MWAAGGRASSRCWHAWGRTSNCSTRTRHGAAQISTSARTPSRAPRLGEPRWRRSSTRYPFSLLRALSQRARRRFSGAAELRVKETDRVATTVEMLQALGVHAEAAPDGLSVEGGAGAPLRSGTVSSYGDHRIAMAGAVAALVAQGQVTVLGWDATATSYPGFEEDLRRCLH